MNSDIETLKPKLEGEVLKSKIAELGSLLHDEWRAPRKKEDGTFEPREKSTKDEAWVKARGTDKVDIANTDYNNLPEDWKGENKASAEVAMALIHEANSRGDMFDTDIFIEEASDKIHDAWLQRNGSWAPPEQNKPYAELSEDEKEKDRAIVRKAIEIYNQGS